VSLKKNHAAVAMIIKKALAIIIWLGNERKTAVCATCLLFYEVLFLLTFGAPSISHPCSAPLSLTALIAFHTAVI